MVGSRSESILPAMYFNPAETQHQANLWNQRAKMGLLPHLNPGSTLVAAMGAHWHPGSFEAVLEMVKYTSEEGGLLCHFYSEQDRCYEPYDGLGTMRNLAYMRAILQGFEYILYVDNDVMPEKDTLIKLQQYRVPVVAPRLSFKAKDEVSERHRFNPLEGGEHVCRDCGAIQANDGNHFMFVQESVDKNMGLAMPPSLLLSMMLFKTDIFFPWATGDFWDNARGSDEEYHFLRLAMNGHHPFIATDVTVPVLNAPHFPFDHIRRGVEDLAPKDAIQSWRKREAQNGV